MQRVRAARKRGNKSKEGGLFCSFCGKSQHQVRKLIAGPSVFICDECVGFCNKILDSKASREADAQWQPWESMTDADLLVTLPDVLEHSEAIRAGLQSRVDELRKREVSWAKIGEALNMSRQAAWERFA